MTTAPTARTLNGTIVSIGQTEIIVKLDDGRLVTVPLPPPEMRYWIGSCGR